MSDSSSASPVGPVPAPPSTPVPHPDPHPLPLLSDVYPALVSFLASKLAAEDEPALAQGVARLRFHGWCTCSRTCAYLRTAPADRADNSWIHLDDGDTPLVCLQLDREHTSFAGMEICAFELGPAPALDPRRPARA
ncbi:hypothetical protein [Streptomyces sp. BF23-19]|uniref:hypothetical protein n=1 Tax=Streptomyces TaxID=1883 RepID=UPI0034E55102|nr:hypothetical protein OG253_08170 [Streptomyces virginiae]